MSSLADLPELVGFFSYSREDDADSHGALSALRSRIQGELRGQLGRTAKTFRLWQDKEAIPSGTLWETEIKNAVAQSVFFIPIITPTVVASPYCRFELESFLAREAALGRSDLVFPILYIDVPALEDSRSAAKRSGPFAHRQAPICGLARISLPRCQFDGSETGGRAVLRAHSRRAAPVLGFAGGAQATRRGRGAAARRGETKRREAEAEAARRRKRGNRRRRKNGESGGRGGGASARRSESRAQAERTER